MFKIKAFCNQHPCFFVFHCKPITSELSALVLLFCPHQLTTTVSNVAGKKRTKTKNKTHFVTHNKLPTLPPLYKRAALYWTHNHSKVCTKEGRCNCPAVFSQGKHTRLTEYHGIHTDKLVISSFGRLFKFIYHYIIDLFSALWFDLISHYSTNGRITLWKKCTPPPKTPGPRGASERSGSFQTSLPLLSSSLSHNVNIYIQHACVHGYQK